MQYRLRVFLEYSLLLMSVNTALCHLRIRPPTKDGNIHIEGKIVGGTAVPKEKFPYTVQFMNYGALCAGSIINVWTVLTAAHCFDVNTDIDSMELLAGARYTYDFAADVYEVAHFVVHEDYNKVMRFACDVALIFTGRQIRLSSKTSKAILIDTGEWMVDKKSNFTVTGWGWTKYGGVVSKFGLMMTNLRYVSSKKCSELHNLNLSIDMFCLYGDGIRDSCKGDSGGGVEWNSMIVGIVSHGDGCAKKDKPSVYANVWHFRRWILNNINKYILEFCNQTVPLTRQVLYSDLS